MTNIFLTKIILAISSLINSETSQESMDHPSTHLEQYPDQTRSKDINEVQRQMQEFLTNAKVSTLKELESFRSALNELSTKLEDEFNNLSSEDWDEIFKNSNFIELAAKIFNNVRDDVFAKEGMIIQGKYPGVYKIFLKTEKLWKIRLTEFGKYRLVKYKISETDSGLSFENLPNVELIFLDENGFHVYSKQLGNINAHDKITGEFEIPEKAYQKIFSVHFRCS